MSDVFVHENESYQIIKELTSLILTPEQVKELKQKYNCQLVVKTHNKLLFLQKINEVTIVE